MKPMLIRSQRTKGFALPTIIIAAVVLLTVLVTSVTAVGSITAALANQYYNQLAREAAESGLAAARACLRANDFVAQWSDLSPLKPDTSCAGVTNGSYSKWIVNSNNVRTSFTVGAPQVGASNSLRVTATGTVELVRASDTNQVWRTYSYVGAENSRYNDLPQIAGGAGWKGNGHNGYMLASTGVLYGWGDNSGQQLGDTSLGTTVSTPIKITLPTGVDRAKKIANSGQGASILCVLATHTTLGDQVYCRGIPGAAENGLMPAAPGWHRFALPGGLTVLDMAVNGVSGLGADGFCVRASDLQAYCAGENYVGQLGQGTTTGGATSLAAPTRFRLDLASPGPVSGLASALTVQKVFHQDWMTCVIASDNQAYCAGANAYGQLGQGTTTTNVDIGKSIPGRVLIPGSPTVLEVVMTYHAPAESLFFRVADGTVYMSGNNRYGTAADSWDYENPSPGQCAVTNSYNCYLTPRATNWGGFGKIISIGREGASYNSICAVGIAPGTPPDSSLWCMGRNTDYGQLGLGQCTSNVNALTTYSPVNGERVAYTMNPESTYQMNSLTVITTAGNAYAVGDNTYGKLGTGAPLQACNPTFARVQLPVGVKAVAVANGDEYSTFILGDNGKIYAMGRNNNGQLGDGTTTNRSLPVEVKIPRQQTIY